MHGAEEYNYERLPKYPHMRPADEIIWNAYLDKNPADFIRCYYDVKVGEPEIPEIQIEEKLKQAWRDLTRWGIDVLAEDNRFFYVIEVKPNANAKALGQALAYAKIWEEKRRPNKIVVPVVLTDIINPITAKAAGFMGVELWEP